MFNKALLMAYTKEVDDTRYTLSFVASNDGSGINFFTGVSDTRHPDDAFTVKINGETTDQSYKSLSFVSGDEVVVACEKRFSFPTFSANGKDYIKEVSPLPLMTSSYGYEVTSFYGVFRLNQGLTSVSEDLFANNTKAVDFSYAFYGCNGLTSLPENLFANNAKATDFSWAFESCSSLTSIPESLFANNTNVTKFKYTFYGCRQLSGRVKIGSPNVTTCSDFCKNTGAITVIVPAGSTTEATFRAYAETVTNLTVETF